MHISFLAIESVCNPNIRTSSLQEQQQQQPQEVKVIQLLTYSVLLFMYSGLDKGGGGVVGPGCDPFLTNQQQYDVDEQLANASADEILCCEEEVQVCEKLNDDCNENDDNEEIRTRKVFLKAIISKKDGEIEV